MSEYVSDWVPDASGEFPLDEPLPERGWLPMPPEGVHLARGGAIDVMKTNKRWFRLKSADRLAVSGPEFIAYRLPE